MGTRRPTADGPAGAGLFRADGLSRLTENDLATLATLGVVTVIDLRTDLEADTQGRFPPDRAGVTYHHLPLTDTLPGEEESADWDRAAFVSERYLAMLSEGTATVSDAIGLLADPARRPAVFHCSVGKDRTGVLAALVLGFLGVPDDVIVDDYALSYDAMLRILAHLKERYPESGEIVERYRPVILSAEPGLDGRLRGRGAPDLRFLRRPGRPPSASPPRSIGCGPRSSRAPEDLSAGDLVDAGHDPGVEQGNDVQGLHVLLRPARPGWPR